MSIAERLAALEYRVEQARQRSPHAASSPRIIAVSKRHSAAAIEEAYAAGQRDFGENYAQELVAKLGEVASADSIRWHFIGHLQRNKVKALVGHAGLFHAVDSERLLRAIDGRAAAAGIVQDVLVAVNIAGEEQKSGVAPGECAALVELAHELESVRCAGLMTMPPLARAAEDNRAAFRELRELRDRLASAEHSLAELSMGTTADFEVAVEEGATLVRVGTAIFGPRPEH